MTAVPRPAIPASALPAPSQPVPALRRTSALFRAHITAAARSSAPGPAWIAHWRPAQDPGPCPADPLHWHFVIDESGSVTSYADPLRYRRALLRRALIALASTCRCRACTIELITFGCRTDTDLVTAGPTRWNRAGLATITALLDHPPATGSRLFGAAQHIAADVAPGTHPVVIISDFELFDDNPADIYRALAAHGPTHAIALRREPPDELAAAGIAQTRVGDDSPSTTIADAVATLYANHRRPSSQHPGRLPGLGR